jgi:signal transduction histidine kinase/ActR/RegA family two-component response regulator
VTAFHADQVVVGGFLALCALASGGVALRRRQAARLLLPLALATLAVLSVLGPSFDNVVNQGAVVPLGLSIMQWAVACGFFVIGVLALTDWLRRGGRARMFLAYSLVLLGALSVFGQVWLRYSTSPQPTGVSVVLLLLSGYFFFVFRDSVIPVRRATMRVVTALTLASGLVGLVVQLPNNRTAAPSYSTVQAADVLVIIGVWVFCVGEPCLRLWLHSNTLPVVQRMRARFLSLGYGGIIALLVIAVPLILIFKALEDQPVFTYSLEAFVIALQPLLYFALFPPAWLRRFWRETEEERFRLAVHELLLGTPDSKTLAAQCLDWAVRLVGAEAGCIVGLDGEMLATSNLSREQALMLAGATRHDEGRQALRLDPGQSPSNIVIVPMRSEFGEGAIAVVAGRFTPLLGSDEVNRLSQYAASVTAAFDRMLLLDQLTQARALAETASKRKSDHLARMSHELRTPMSAIIGFADLLAMNDPREDQREDINAIIKAAEHLLALINEVLEIALIESGGGSLSLEPVNLAKIVDDAITLVERRARVENISLAKQLDDPAAFVLADNQRLRQVMVNLLSNAVKYNRPDGAVVVKTARHNGSIRIEVSDTGRGLGKNAAEHLFEPFDRMGQERSDIEGTGLGLALTKALVEAMHGSIGVESSEGAGSTFWFEIRGTDAPAAEPEVEDESAEPAGSPARVEFRDLLYVEDNLANVELVDRVLAQERPRLHLVPVSSGADALEYLESHHPGMIMLDLHLGDINGDEVLRRIRANPRLEDIPVVMLSADAAAPQIDRLTAMGANEYLTKPVRVKTLLRVVDEGMAGTLKSSRVAVDEKPA